MKACVVEERRRHKERWWERGSFTSPASSSTCGPGGLPCLGSDAPLYACFRCTNGDDPAAGRCNVSCLVRCKRHGFGDDFALGATSRHSRRAFVVRGPGACLCARCYRFCPTCAFFASGCRCGAALTAVAVGWAVSTVLDSPCGFYPRSAERFTRLTMTGSGLHAARHVVGFRHSYSARPLWTSLCRPLAFEPDVTRGSKPIGKYRTPAEPDPASTPSL